MPISMATMRFSASRFLSIAWVQFIAASDQGGGIIARVGRGVDKIGREICDGVSPPLREESDFSILAEPARARGGVGLRHKVIAIAGDTIRFLRPHKLHLPVQVPNAAIADRVTSIALSPALARLRRTSKVRPIVALYTVWHNMIRVNDTLHMSPAMAAGVLDKLWSMDDLREAMEAVAPHLGPRDLYGKGWRNLAKSVPPHALPVLATYHIQIASSAFLAMRIPGGCGYPVVHEIGLGFSGAVIKRAMTGAPPSAQSSDRLAILGFQTKTPPKFPVN